LGQWDLSGQRQLKLRLSAQSDPLALGFLLSLSTQSDPLARSALQHLTLRLSDLLGRWDR